MQSEIKSNFEKSLKEGNFSSSQKDIKEKRKMGHLTTLI